MVDIGEKSWWNISAVSCGSVHKILILARSAGFFFLLLQLGFLLL